MRRASRWREAVFAGLCAFGAAAPSAAARTVSYDQKTILDGEVTMAKVVMQDNQFRMEAVQDGTNTVAIRNDRGIFTYLPDEHLAMKLPALETSQGTVIQDLNDFVGYVNEHNGTVIGAEVIDGKPCDIYQFTDPANGNATKAWVWKDQQFPLRLEVDGPEGTITTEFMNVQFDIPVDASAFELPPGIELTSSTEGAGLMGDLMHKLGNEEEP